MVLYIKKGERIRMDHYLTPGFAHEFGAQKIGKKDTCAMIKEAFKQAFKGAEKKKLLIYCDNLLFSIVYYYYY